jgi:hypothetical protein
MGQLFQLAVGIVLGMLAHSSFIWLYQADNNLPTSRAHRTGSDNSGSRSYDQQLFTKGMTKEDIESGVGVHRKLAEYGSDARNTWHGKLQFIEVSSLSEVKYIKGLSSSNHIAPLTYELPF